MNTKLALMLLFITSMPAWSQEADTQTDNYYTVTYYWAFHEGGSGPDGLDPTKISQPHEDRNIAVRALAAWEAAHPNTLRVTGIGEKTVRVPIYRSNGNRNPPPTEPLDGPRAKLPPVSKSELEKEYDDAVRKQKEEFENAFNRLSRQPLINDWDQLKQQVDQVEKQAANEGNPIESEDDPRIRTLRERIKEFAKKRADDQRGAEDVLSLARKLGMTQRNSKSSTDRGSIDRQLTGPWKGDAGSRHLRYEIWILATPGTVEVSSHGGTGASYHGVKSALQPNGRFQFVMRPGFANQQSPITGEGRLVGDKLHITMRRDGEVTQGTMIKQKD